MSIRVKRFRPHAIEPQQKTDGAAGFDLHVALPEVGSYVDIGPGETRRVPTGWGFEFPSTLVGMVLPRSSWTDRLDTKHPPVDSDYRGEVHIIVRNDSKSTLRIQDGERIAQIVFLLVMTPLLLMVDDLEESGRGDGAFGSTGGCSRS